MTFSITEQFSSGENEFPIPTSQYNPLDEPSPLGLLQMRPTQGNVSSVTSAPSGNLSLRDRKDVKGTATSATTIKLKALNFRALLLRIGQWEEILEGGLQSKIEIQWSDIIALKANLPDDGPGSLTVTLTKPSYFFKETNPQPRKHTLWQATAEFTDGQASLHRQHFLHTRPVKQTVGIYFLSTNTCQGDADVSAEVPRVLVVCAEMILARPRLSPKKSESQISG
ncbi:hypothetical protein ACSBR2_025199 [Camellia fascicularis]